jgi:hypothetical protein
VWEHNNLAQKNLTIVDLRPNAWILVPVVVANLRSLVTRRLMLELVRPLNRPDLEVGLVHPSARAFPSGLTLHQLTLHPDVGDTVAPPPLDCGGRANWPARRPAALHRVITSDDAGTAVGRWGAGLEARFAPGRTAQIPFEFRPQVQRTYYLRIAAPGDAQPGETFLVDLVARNRANQQVLGGIAVQIRVR